MSNQPIVFIDSGIGGLPYLEWLKSRQPLESFVYIADNEHFPFGTKSREELISIMSGTMETAAAAYNPKAAVIACNTASVISLASLRARFSFPIIGVVPAIKPAALASGKKRIGLMASNRTIEDEYTAKLITDFASDCTVFRYAGTEIIDFIENRLNTAVDSEIEKVISPAAAFFRENDVDNIVLGCTHFLFLEEHLNKSFGAGVRITDSREGVGRQIIRILTDNNLLSEEKGKDIFIITGQSDTRKYLRYAWVLEKYDLCRA